MQLQDVTFDQIQRNVYTFLQLLICSDHKRFDVTIIHRSFCDLTYKIFLPLTISNIGDDIKV